ncbi:SDR family oxidoreductase [Nitrospinaceae bacterium]|nr:SDR family oxidoreductase [Nitrospinaceae bacterium]
MEGKINNKRVLITGASKGLGSVCAKEFADRGARLMISGRNVKKLEELRQTFPDPDSHRVFAGDLTCPEICKDLVGQAMNFLGGVDVIVHVAGGGYGFRDPLLTWDQMNTLFKVNIASAAEINRLAIPEMVKKQSGYVIHVGSIASQEATGSVGYNTVKSALAAYVRGLGRDLASSGVIITGILPGAFYAPNNAWRRLEANEPEVVQDFIQKNLPRKKIAEAEEIVPLILFLSSDSASMMSGSCVPIDAGEGKAYAV